MRKCNLRHGCVLLGAVLLFSLLGSMSASAQAVRLPRAKVPFTLLGFESPDAAGKWTGMKCELTKAHVSEGNSALSIFYPKWNGKGDQYLPAQLKWDNGQGYSAKDWSHYGKISFDAWVDGDTPLDLDLEFCNKNDDDGWTKEVTVQPGKKNTFELSLADASDVIDLTNVRTIVVYAIRPAKDTRLILDNVRLLPGEKLPIAAFDLAYPNYRRMIFPGVANIKVTAGLNLGEYNVNPANLSLTLTAVGGKIKTSNRVQAAGSSDSISVSAKQLPAGPVNLTAVLGDNNGKVLAKKTWSLRKLSSKDVAALKVYIDENDNTIVDGKPFFPLGWFGNTSLDQLAEIADGPFNTMLPYGADSVSKAYMSQYLDTLNEHGMKLIYCMNDIYPTATYLDGTGWEGVKGNNNIADAVIKAYKNNPAILAWYLNDERPKELVPKLEGYYQRVQRDDPSHPCYIVIYQMPELKYFPSTTDIMGVDRYPIPMDPITKIDDEMRLATAAVKGHKPIWAVIQAFGWYQYNEEFPDRGRTPTEADLRAGRAPSYDETRCMTYLALVHGAKGILYYCYYDTRVLPQYAEMWSGIKKIAGEVKAISPILLSPNDLGEVSCSPSDSKVETKLKDLDGQLYLIAVNSQNKPCKVTFDLKQPLPSSVSVMFEGRFAMDIHGNKLTDNFKPLEVHVYNLGRRR